MIFSPDRTANLPPRTCPSSNNHARHRLQLRLGAAAEQAAARKAAGNHEITAIGPGSLTLIVNAAKAATVSDVDEPQSASA